MPALPEIMLRGLHAWRSARHRRNRQHQRSQCSRSASEAAWPARCSSLLCEGTPRHILLCMHCVLQLQRSMLPLAAQPPCSADTVAAVEIHAEPWGLMKAYNYCAGHIQRSLVARVVEGCLFALVACPVVCALHLPWSMQHAHMLQLRDSSPHILRPAVDPLGAPRKQIMSGARQLPP